MMYPFLWILSNLFQLNLLKFTQPLNFIGNLIWSTFIAFQHFNWMRCFELKKKPEVATRNPRGLTRPAQDSTA